MDETIKRIQYELAHCEKNQSSRVKLGVEDVKKLIKQAQRWDKFTQLSEDQGSLLLDKHEREGVSFTDLLDDIELKEVNV